jgi:surface polysaccharide O-acyltransferase-like enzyme
VNNQYVNLPYKNNSRIAFLDYLRIFAFLSVLVGHLFFGDLQQLFSDPSIHATPRSLVGLLMPLCESGGAGVVVFFLISGYIITSVLQSENTVSFLVKSPVSEDLAALLLLLFYCYIMMRFVEVKWINIGKCLLKNFPQYANK